MRSRLAKLGGGLLVVAAALCAASAMAQVLDGMQGQGIIESVDPETHSLIISGLAYAVSVDAKVEVRGSYGAFTMLQKGMKVSYTYDQHSSTERVIRELTQLPDSAVIEEY